MACLRYVRFTAIAHKLELCVPQCNSDTLYIAKDSTCCLRPAFRLHALLPSTSERPGEIKLQEVLMSSQKAQFSVFQPKALVVFDDLRFGIEIFR